LKALELADAKQKKELDKWLGLENFEDESKVEAVKTIFEELEIEQLTNTIINSYFDRSLKLIESLEADPAKKEHLKTFLQNLMNRDH
jgi:geranylgeranyl diphosphate synthase type II